MKYQSTVIFNLLTAIFLFANIGLKAQCDDPLSLDWLQPYLGSSCTDKVYAFTYNDEAYVYATSTPSCIAADARNTLYNCNTGELCYIFGFTPPSEQCNADLQQAIQPFLTNENVIYPLGTIAECNNPLQLEWLSPLLGLNCTDGVYAFSHNRTGYVYRSTACENVDDPNYLYNCSTKEICYVEGRTYPNLQCDLTEFPLNDYLIRENLIWSSPLLDFTKDFPWISSKLDIKGCNNETISRYDEGRTTFISVNKDNLNTLYDADGERYCRDRDNLDCLDVYDLEEPTNQWQCNAREPSPTCEAIDADDLPGWLSEYIDGLSCECGGEILQYCYNNETYISYEANAPFCNDYSGFIFDENGTQICQNGGITGGDCFTVLPNFFEEAELVNDLWACEDCSRLTFTEAYLDCGRCCDDLIFYKVTGTSTSYTVTNVANGEEVLSGDQAIGIVSPNGNIELIVTTLLGCSASVSIPYEPWCCEVPPICSVDDVYYDCVEGLQIEASSTFGGPVEDPSSCYDSAIFEDQYGNIYQTGSVIDSDGIYELTLNGGGSISPACGTFELVVECDNNGDPCQLDAGEIVSDPDLCGLGIVSLEADYEYTNGPDDNEYVFVHVYTDDSFEVLRDNIAYGSGGCYYGIHYRYSCDVPDFEVATFSEILNADANYAVTPCFQTNYLSTPEYFISTEPYCDGEGLFTFGVTVTGGTGSYIIGEDYTGETVYGETGENFITYASGLEFYDVFPYDAENGCATDYIIPIDDPGCGIFAGACELPAEPGPCEAYIPRYYYDSEEQDCLQFIYGGCQGNANNFETYELCMESCGSPGATCAPGQPINWSWIQNLISQRDFCDVHSIDQFTYNNDIYFKVSPYTSGNFCPDDWEYYYYDCEGNVVCVSGFWIFPGDPYHCDDDEFIDAADNNSTNIWTYNFEACADPFDLEIVQNAIIYPSCTGGIYSFSYQNEDYVYISTLCEYVDDSNTLYNCNTGQTCYIGGENIPVQECYDLYNEIEYLINNENLIWGSCENKVKASVRDYSGLAGCGFVFELDDGTVLEPKIVNLYNITFVEGLRVEFSYIPLNQPSNCQVGLVSEIFCLSVIEEERDCSNPLQLEIVQNAIADNCTGSIYALNYENNDYIFIKNICNYEDISDALYNCNTDKICSIGGLAFPDEACDDIYSQVQPLINNENLIWSKTCAYEYTGTVRDYTGLDGCGFIIELDNTSIIEPIIIDLIDFTFIDGLRVEFSFVPLNQPTICQVGIVSEIICIRETEEEKDCSNPLELVIVQNATKAACAGNIYAFNYQNEDYVYISTLCEFIDDANTLYNCTTSETCYTGGFSGNAECFDLYEQVQPLINNENLIWARPCNYEHKGTVTDDPQNGCGYDIELDDGTIIEPIHFQEQFILSPGQRVELSYSFLQDSNGCRADYYVNIICIREVKEPTDCSDPAELEIVKNAVKADCTGSIYAFNFQNEDYVYISTLCQFIDATNTLYNCTTDETCHVGGFSGNGCLDIYEQVQPLINDENLIWSRPCDYEHKGVVADDPQNGCGIVIELEDGTKIEPVSIQGGFTLTIGQRVELSYNIIQPSFGGCSADFYVNIICVREVEEPADCSNPFELEIVQNAIVDERGCLQSIYAFDYQDESYLYFDNRLECEIVDFSDALYNCNTGFSCNINACDLELNEIEQFLIPENIIWPDCSNYEYTGTVAGFYLTFECSAHIIEIDNGETIYVSNFSVQNFELYEGQRVEFNLHPDVVSFPLCPPLHQIICIREIDEGCVCDADYTPVCGVDGNTYGNACEAECAGIEIAYEGECDESCNCPAVYDPVCGVDGNTYGNACEAECEGVEIVYEGECEEPCICPDVLDPVCGVDGNTYGNACEAECEGVEIAYEGECITQQSNHEIFEEFPWLLDFVEPEFCADGLTIDVYMKRHYYYIFVKFPAANGELYREDGRFYCDDSDSFSCVEAYSLTELMLVNSWTCNSEPPLAINAEFSNLICNNDGTFSISVNATGSFSGSYGIYGRRQDGSAPEFFDFEEGETFTFTGRATDAQNNVYTIFIYDSQLADVAATPFEINIEECNQPPATINAEFSNLICSDDGTFSIDVNATGSFSSSYGIYGRRQDGSAPEFFDFEESETFTFTGRTTDAQNNIYTIFIYDSRLADVAATPFEINIEECIEPPAIINAEFSNLICNDDATFSIDVTAVGARSGSYGAYGTVGDSPPVFAFEEGETFTFTGGIGNVVDNLYTLYIYDYFLADVGATPFEINIEACIDDEGSDPIFEQYPWLSSIISPENCQDGSRVIEYDLGSYAFIFIETPAGNTLYFDDGTRYCRDRENRSCEEIYELTTPTKIWNCSDQPPPPPSTNCLIDDPLALDWVTEKIEDWGSNQCGLKEVKFFNYEGDDYIHMLSYPIYPYCPTDTGGSQVYDCEGNQVCYSSFGFYEPCEPGLSEAANAGNIIWEYTGGTTDNGLVEKYPWLYDLFDPFNCLGVIVNEYDNGSYAFISVEDENGLILYFESGERYCRDRENRSCVEIYELEDVTASWECGFGKQSNGEKVEQKLSAIEEEINIYPNPSDGIFTLDLTNIHSKIQKIEIYDITGKLHHIPINYNEIDALQKLNIENLKSGSYIITVLTKNKQHAKTILIK